MDTQRGILRLKDVRRRFDRAAVSFDESDFVHRTSFDGLIDRLKPVKTKPSRILDLGAATGTGSRQLAKNFRKSRVISLDLSSVMLRIAKKQKSLLSKTTELQGDATNIPLQTGSIDLVFANMLLPWISDLPACLTEISRVLKKGGVFAFATLGPESFAELHNAWAGDEEFDHVNPFPDMHDVGDALMKAGLIEPVLDMDYLTVTYRDNDSFYRDLSNSGARNSLSGRRKTLTGKSRFRRMEAALAGQMRDGHLPLNLELVYGHAWGVGPRPEPGEYLLEPASIGRRQRR
jgi:malonyl-CoA O-methyltransferase